VGKGQKGLYFIAGVAPTDKERAEAASLGIKAFRNAELAGATRVERCDVAAGLVPAAYNGFPGVQVVKAAPTADELAAKAKAEAEAKAQAEADALKNKRR
jgi:hypothetical protein